MSELHHPTSAETAPLRWWERVENGAAVAILAVMAALPVIAVTVRWITGQAWLAGANGLVQVLNLWIAFVGGMIAARSQRHLALSTGTFLQLSPRGKDALAGFTAAVTTACAAFLAYGSALVVIAERGSNVTVWGGIPAWVVQTIMPFGFLVMAVRFALIGNRTWQGRLAALAAVIAAGAVALVPPGEREIVVWLGMAVILAALLLGAPLFTTLGGVTMLLFVGAPVPISISAVPTETYAIVASSQLPSLPLFTMAGYMLAEGGASKRLVRVIRAWFGWLPGGSAIAAILVCAFFTTFTGASGVTILALGGLLLPILTAAGYTQRYAIGLLTASGSLGLLFPPSLPVILYGVASHVPIDQLFLGGAVPGVVLMLLLILMSVYRAVRDGAQRSAFDAAEARASLWDAKWEVALPILVLISIFGGFMTLFESAAWTAAYAFLSEVVIHRDLHIKRDVPRVVVESATLMGAVLLILGMALGFTSYLVDAEIPMQLTAWVQDHVGSRFAFLLLLNFVLLFLGSLMEVYSAIMVMVPLIVPIATVFGINPVHLGILFLANLELGYLTPPVGLNLFLSSFRFRVPLVSVYRDVVPFFFVLLGGVLFISYAPWLTTWGIEPSSGTPGDLDSALEGDPALEGAPPPAEGMPALTPEQLEQMLKEVEGDPVEGDPAEGAPAEGAAPAPAPGALPLDPAELQRALEEEPDPAPEGGTPAEPAPSGP